MLSMTLEDYLESIFLLGRGRNPVRITDVAKKLKVKKSTVVNAIRKLQQEGFVIHERYGDILLTQKGIEMASRVYERHLAIFSFLVEILGVPEEIANKEACGIEHYIGEETAKTLSLFIEFSRLCPQLQKIIYEDFRKYKNSGTIPDICSEEGKKMLKLTQLKVGQKAIVKKIDCDRSIKSRLLTMGIVPGIEIQVEKVAPLGDPIDILVRGYHLSLRREEAQCIEVEEA